MLKISLKKPKFFLDMHSDFLDFLRVFHCYLGWSGPHVSGPKREKREKGKWGGGANALNPVRGVSAGGKCLRQWEPYSGVPLPDDVSVRRSSCQPPGHRPRYLKDRVPVAHRAPSGCRQAAPGAAETVFLDFCPLASTNYRAS